MKISIIIPAYNEESRIIGTIFSVHRHMSQYYDDYEIIVVNDGSRDRTSEEVMNMQSEVANLKLIDNKVNQGKGGAVRDGMLAAQGEVRLFMDADGSTSIESLDVLLPYLEMGADIVVSSRRVSGARIIDDQPAHRLFLGWVFRKATQIITALDVVDSQNGFKVFRGYVAEQIFQRTIITGWAFDVEVLSIAKRLGYRSVEVPIVWTNDGRSKVKFSGMVKMMVDVISIGWKVRTGGYDEKNGTIQVPIKINDKNN